MTPWRESDLEEAGRKMRRGCVIYLVALIALAVTSLLASALCLVLL